MTTAAVAQDRLKQRFDKWDVNGNGSIERSDYESEARRIIKAFGETPESPKGRAVMSAYLQMFDQMANKVGQGGKVTEQQFRRYVETQMFEQGDAGFNRVLRPTITAIVNLCDTDGDGEVSPAEFKKWLSAVGVANQDSAASFRKLDTDRSGHLSVEEIVQAVRDFHEGKSDVPLLGN